MLTVMSRTSISINHDRFVALVLHLIYCQRDYFFINNPVGIISENLRSNHNILRDSGVIEETYMDRCKSILLVLLLLVSSLSGMAFSFDENDTDEGQTLGGPEGLNLLQHKSMQNVQGAWSGGGTSNGVGDGIATDSDSNSYITGYFVGAATFGSTTLTSSGSDDIFIAKLNSSGSWDWAVKAGGSSDDNGLGIAVDSSGNAYITGYFEGTAAFGSTSLVTSGSRDIFIAKLDTNGSWQWAVKAGGTGNDAGRGIAIDSSGNVYATGYFNSAATFGSIALSGTYNQVFIS